MLLIMRRKKNTKIFWFMKKHGCVLSSSKCTKSSEIFLNYEKDDCEICTKIWAKKTTIGYNFFQLWGSSAHLYPRFLWGLHPHTPHRGLRSVVLDERQSIETQVNRFSCILVNVSESGPIYEFSTFFLLRFWYKFHRRIFFMILIIFWLFIYCKEEKQFCSTFFQAKKNSTLTHNLFFWESYT